MVDEKLFEKLSARIKNSRNDFVELERLLTSIPALGPINGGKGEWAKAKALRQYLEAAGFGRPEEYNALDSSVPEGTRPNMVFRIPGKKKAPTIWFLTHLDVVPPGEGWNQDPFTLKVEADRVIGRGGGRQPTGTSGNGDGRTGIYRGKNHAGIPHRLGFRFR